MSDAQKLHIARTLSLFANQKISDAIQLTGKGLPCSVIAVSGSIITVKFELNSSFTLPSVTVPMFGGEYIRYPTQIGDKGVVIPMDARLSGISGIGGGVADLSQPANLTPLVFLPISNTDWSGVDSNSVTIYGPNGVVLRDTGSNSTFVLTPTSIIITGENSVTVTSGGATITLHSSGSFSINGTGAGTMQATTMTLSDSVHSTTITGMNSAWTALTNWLNSHTHTTTTSGNPTSSPISPFSGANIAP